MTTIPIRPSSLPIAYHCSGFISRELEKQNGEVTLTYQGDRNAANEGSAAHLLVADWLNGGDMTGEEAIANYAVDGLDAEPGILEWMAREALYFFERLAGSLVSRVKVETRADGVFSGTPDALILDRETKTIHIYDFKFGRLRDKNSRYQLMGYAAAQMGKHPWIEFCELNLIYPRLSDAFVDDLTRADIEDFLRHTREKVAEAKTAPTFTLGDHCTWCKHALTCPSVREALTQLPSQKPDPEIPESIEEGRKLKAAATSWLKRFDAAQKAFIANGDVQLPSGKTLTARPKETKRVSRSATPYLREKLTDAELLKMATFSKGALVDAVKANAAGKKKDAEEEFIESAIKAGAIEVSTTLTIEEK